MRNTDEFVIVTYASQCAVYKNNHLLLEDDIIHSEGFYRVLFALDFPLTRFNITSDDMIQSIKEKGFPHHLTHLKEVSI